MPEPRTYFFESCLGVFQGGGCRGAAFAGALQHVAERGVSFSGVAGTSAGSIIAALLAAGANARQVDSILETLDFKSFLANPEPVSSKVSLGEKIGGFVADLLYTGASSVLRNHGRYSSSKIEEWLNAELKKLLPQAGGRKVKFQDLSMPLWIVAADILAQDVKIWSKDQNPNDEVAYAVRCSCSIPGFFQAVDGRYVDGGLLSNLPSFTFSTANSAVHSKKILAFTLKGDTRPIQLDNPMAYFTAVINTAIDGAANIQARIVENVYEIQIQTGDIASTDFLGMDAKKVQQLKTSGTIAARQFFNSEFEKVRSAPGKRIICEGNDEALAELTTILNVRNIRKICAVDEDSKWIYSIFPAFLKWRSQGVEVHAFLPPEPPEKHEAYRRRLMSELGVVLHSVPKLPFRGFLIDPQNETDSSGLIYMEDTVSGEVRAIKYAAPEDHPAIRSLYSALGPMESPIEVQLPTLERVSDLELQQKLKDHVSQYALASMQMQSVNVCDLVALSSLVREYKYQQIKSLHAMFKAADLDPFDVAIVRYASGKQTIVTPPVVEAAGDKFYLIQGTTRALFCVREGIETIRCLVVRNPSAPLPSQRRTPIRDVLVGGRTLSTTDRYGQTIDADFRRVEYAVHFPTETLI
jgi:predicted acylesterase/phospholipase RssA